VVSSVRKLPESEEHQHTGLYFRVKKPSPRGPSRYWKTRTRVEDDWARLPRIVWGKSCLEHRESIHRQAALINPSEIAAILAGSIDKFSPVAHPTVMEVRWHWLVVSAANQRRARGSRVPLQLVGAPAGGGQRRIARMGLCIGNTWPYTRMCPGCPCQMP